MPRLLLVTPAELTRDQRARRAAINALSLGYGVVGLCGRISGEEPVPLPGVTVIRAGRQGRTNPQWIVGSGDRDERPLLRELRGLYRLVRLARRTITLVRAGRTFGPSDVVHANDLETLPASYLLARERGSRLVYDAHELYAEFEREPPRIARAMLVRLERRLARRADAVVTVSDAIAAELRQRLGVAPIVVLNVPPLDEREPPEPPPGPLRAIYQGAFGTGRSLEDLLEALRNAPSARLTLRVSRTPGEALRRELPRDLADRIDVADPVPPDRVIDGLYGHHVGLLFDRPLTRNAELSSPNKLFEYLMAGLAVVAPRLPGLAWLEEERLGLLAEPGSARSLGKALARLDADRELLAELRTNSRRAALERYNSAAQRDRLAQAWDADR